MVQWPQSRVLLQQTPPEHDCCVRHVAGNSLFAFGKTQLGHRTQSTSLHCAHDCWHAQTLPELRNVLLDTLITGLPWLKACRAICAQAALRSGQGIRADRPAQRHRHCKRVDCTETLKDKGQAPFKPKPGIGLSMHDLEPVTPVSPACESCTVESDCIDISKSRRGREASQAWHARRNRGPPPLQSFLTRRCQDACTTMCAEPPGCMHPDVFLVVQVESFRTTTCASEFLPYASC